MLAPGGTTTNVLYGQGDLGFNALEGLSERLGTRFVNAGVAEQNMIGVAAGRPPISRHSRATSVPCTPGMFMSRMMTSTACLPTS